MGNAETTRWEQHGTPEARDGKTENWSLQKYEMDKDDWYL